MNLKTFKIIFVAVLLSLAFAQNGLTESPQDIQFNNGIKYDILYQLSENTSTKIVNVKILGIKTISGEEFLTFLSDRFAQSHESYIRLENIIAILETGLRNSD